MQNNVQKMVFEKVIAPFEGRKYGFVGAELEYLIIPENDETPLADIGSEFLKYLVEEQGFQAACIGSDGR